jgi:ketosteroid isomerase-like protein
MEHASTKHYRLRAGVCAAFVAVVALTPRAWSQAPGRNLAVEDSVRGLETRRGQALLAADTATLSRLVADDFVEISRIAQLRSKADNLREIATGALKLSTVQYDSLTVRVYGDVAVLMGIADNAGTLRGVPFSGKIRYIRVFVRRSDRWQAVAMQHTMVP